MANDYYVQVDMKEQVGKISDLSYEIYQLQSALDKSVKALDEIVDTPNKMATDSRALREVVRIAQAALDEVVDHYVAEQST